VLNAEYRRVGGGGGWPATFDDARAVVALAREQPEAARLAVLGHSAGGHLALFATAEGGTDAVVALAAPSDLEARPESDILALLGGTPQAVPDRYAVGSPIRRVPLGVPTLLVHGTRDDVVPPRRSRDFAAAARAAGDDVTLVEPDADHRQVVDPRHPAWKPVPAWLRERLSQRDSPFNDT
jgi:dipeptidyl aminopeptidase/acylaminoacyl peptidase